MTYRIQDLIDWENTDVLFVREQVDRAAAAIIPTAPTNWPGWVAYLLGALDFHAGHDFDNTLASVQAAIKERVETGQWPRIPTNVVAELTVHVPTDIPDDEVLIVIDVRN